MRVVADTMIWYRIGDGQIDINLVKRLPIAATALSILEILSSPQLEYEEGRINVLRACRAIWNSNAQIIKDLPYEYAANEYLGKKIKRKFPIEEFYTICKNGLANLDIVNLVKQRKERVSKYRTSLLEQIEQVKLDPDLLRKMENNNEAISIASSDFIHEIGNVLNINSTKINMHRVLTAGKAMNLYLHARARYNQRLSRQQPAGNDQVDLTNLLYVREGDLYWTLDEKWLSIIIEAEKVDKLFKAEITTKQVIDRLIAAV